MTTRPRPFTTCTACGEERPHAAHGWCSPCYRRWNYRGRPESGPPAVVALAHDDVAGTVKGWDWHMRTGTPPCSSCRTAHNGAVLGHYHAAGKPRQLNQARHFTTISSTWTDREQRAARVVAGAASDVEDCRELLQALGLLPYSVADCTRIGGAA